MTTTGPILPEELLSGRSNWQKNLQKICSYQCGVLGCTQCSPTVYGGTDQMLIKHQMLFVLIRISHMNPTLCRSSVGHHEAHHQGLSKGEADVNSEYNYLQKQCPRYDQGIWSPCSLTTTRITKEPQKLAVSFRVSFPDKLGIKKYNQKGLVTSSTTWWGWTPSPTSDPCQGHQTAWIHTVPWGNLPTDKTSANKHLSLSQIIQALSYPLRSPPAKR